ncbi:MAG: terpene cyclase/mutase family protein [Deltaproteobacteria bacterium]|nr:terpene cyclase/mutase family protein [Deltaproteobacteria bacterium]
MPSERDTAAARDRGLLKVGSSFMGRVLRDAAGAHSSRQSRDEHLRSAVEWLQRAAAATPDDGVSYGYSVRGGWRPSYRETSGYIAVTFFDLAQRLGDSESATVARTVSNWLCEVQEADGSIANPLYRAHEGIVFDTGQVLLGYVRAYRETGEPRFRDSAVRASSWLVSRLDEDGAWRKNTHLETPHTYNTRVAWAMLECHDIAPGQAFEAAARKNLDWALSQEKDGYFRSCAFEPGVAPFTHTIAYAIRGFLESGRLLDEPKYTDAAVRAADAVLEHVRQDGWIPGQIDENGHPAARYCCLTGNCQLAIIWLKLYKSTGSERYLDAAKRSLGFVMDHQDLTTSNLALRGAIKGSHPIWGRYAPLSYPNWPTKFFIDGVLLWNEIES